MLKIQNNWIIIFSWIFLASVEELCGVWVYLKDFFPPLSVSFTRKSLFFTGFQVFIQVACVAKVLNFILTRLHLYKVIICSHEIPPLRLFLTHYMKHTYLFSTAESCDNNKNHSRAGRRKRSKKCTDLFTVCGNSPLLALQTLTITFKRNLIAVQHFCPFADPLIVNVSKF